MSSPSTSAREAALAAALTAPARRPALRCPHCREADVRRSHARGLPERVLRWFGIVPYRCLGCDHRFFRPRYTRAR